MTERHLSWEVCGEDVLDREQPAHSSEETHGAQEQRAEKGACFR